MMAQKHLHELLKEDQEPFLLKNYITDRRCHLKTPSPKTQLQVKKRKPISETPSFPRNFRKNVCFLSFHDSPDLSKSPMFDFSSPAKSPCRSPNTILLHIPARTAALLLEAALRIQKQSSAPKPKTQNKNPAFGLFGSILKRLTHRSRKREIEGDEGDVSVKDVLMWDSSVGRRRTCNESLKKVQKKMVAEGDDQSASKLNACETNHCCSCNSRPSSAFWSESNEDRSLDMDFSSSSQSVDSEVVEFLSRRREDTDIYCCEKHFCESPFRFVLQRSPSSGRRTPEFTSPTASPTHHKTEEKETSCGSNFEEDEDKEQCSPVSVLDPPFEDDDGHEDEEDVDENGDDSFDDQCSSSYAIVQRAKQKLLHKLRRFEKLAGLDPIELEKRMLEEEEEDDDDNDDDDDDGDHNNAEDQEEEDKNEYVLDISDREKNVEAFVMEVIGKSRFQNSVLQIPQDMKRLVSDLIVEEGREELVFDKDREDQVVNKVCKRLEAWKEVESNTINMMVEQDLRRSGPDGWKGNQEQVGETALEIEMAIFELLVQEVFEDQQVSLGGK